MGASRKAAGQLIFVGGVARHELQHEVMGAARHVASAHFGPSRHHLFKAFQHRLALAVQTDEGEEPHLAAKHLAIELGVIPLDIARLRQRSHTTKSWSRGNSETAGMLEDGYPPFCVKVLE